MTEDSTPDAPARAQQGNGSVVSTAQLLKSVTRRGRLVPAVQRGGLDLQTENGRYELLGLYELEVREGDEVEIDGIPAPLSLSSPAPPGLLVHEIRHLD